MWYYKAQVHLLIKLTQFISIYFNKNIKLKWSMCQKLSAIHEYAASAHVSLSLHNAKGIEYMFDN